MSLTLTMKSIYIFLNNATVDTNGVVSEIVQMLEVAER